MPGSSRKLTCSGVYVFFGGGVFRGIESSRFLSPRLLSITTERPKTSVFLAPVPRQKAMGKGREDGPPRYT